MRLMRLMDARLFDIIRQEHKNRNCIHLYGTGEYWAAFEQSAYLLCRIFPENETAVVMANIPDRTLKVYSRSHIFRCDEADYKEFIAEEITPKQYQIWHRKEVQGFL